MHRCEKNEATLGYKMPKMYQAPVAVHCAMRIAENKASKRQAAQVVYIAISAANVAKVLPHIVLDAPEVEQVGT